MVELAEIFRQAGPAYRQAFEGRVLPSQARAMRVIALCRTPALGGSLYACNDCGALDYSYHSCRNRHCPKCQQDRAQQWLERTRARLLPCDHYLLTFTLPQQLRVLARSHPEQVYSALLREAAASVQLLAGDPNWVGATLGILAVLHTWSRTLDYHPHAHLLVSAGGLSPDRTAWVKPAHPRFFMPGYALSKIFRAKMRHALARAGFLGKIDDTVWGKAWTVHIQQIGRGLQAALYLSRYVYCVALTNHRIERFDNGCVTFRYTHSRTHETRRLTLPVNAFIARFLQHILPPGFTKIRSYGLLSPGCHADLEQARHFLQHQNAQHEQPSPHTLPTSSETTCPATSDSPADLLSATANDTPNASTLRCPVCHRGHLLLIRRLRRSRAPP
jgi:hypothetical protein